MLRRPVEFGQYTSHDFAQVLDDHDVLASIGSVGDAYDNAMAESFVDSFKTELISDRVWRTRSQLELAIVEWVGWFNDVRLHESLDDVPPAEFETLSLSGSASSHNVSACAAANRNISRSSRQKPVHMQAYSDDQVGQTRPDSRPDQGDAPAEFFRRSCCSRGSVRGR